MRRYPNGSQMTARFLAFDERVLEIREIEAAGGDLSTEERAALDLHDVLQARLAFLGKPGAPDTAARVADKQPDGVPKDTTPAPDHGPSAVRYVGGVKIRTDYSLRDVLGITANAAKAPFASFVASARDLISKAVQGKALTAQEEQDIYRYASLVDAFTSLTRVGGAMQGVGDVLIGVKTLTGDADADPDTLAAPVMATRGVVSPQPAITPQRGKQAPRGRGSVTVTAASAPAQTADAQIAGAKTAGAKTAGAKTAGAKTTGAKTTGAKTAGAKTTGPRGASRQPLFDFPQFSIPFPFKADSPATPEVVRKPEPGFNPPQRLPDGRTGYVLSPTRPPHLPDNPANPPVAGPSRDRAGSARARQRGGKTPGSAAAVPPRSASQPARMPSVTSTELKRIAGKGPISIDPAATPLDDSLRVMAFGAPFFFYRNDKDVQMTQPRPARKTDYDDRRDVLQVAGGEHVTSYVANSKVNAGKFWGSGPAGQLQGAEVLELGNGRQGVGAIKLPFANLRPGATIVVSGGAMNGCTMLFASDGRALYAYHAGSADVSPGWFTSQQGAQSIVKAHQKIGPATQREYKWHGTNSDLVVMGRQYPFSALIYSGRFLGNTEALVGASALLGAVAGAAEPVPNAHLHVPRHAYGPRHGARWHMMTFNYAEHDRTLRTVGTAEAVITRDLNGAVTVRVLAEKGKLDRGSSIGERGGPIAYRYKTTDSESATYFVPK
ncbi:hypothetical protein GCM10027093_44060 [Paraburkholderia jirisanensis]